MDNEGIHPCKLIIIKFHQNDLNLAYFQPIISLCEGDLGQLNLNILTDKGLINFSSFKWEKPYFEKTPQINFLNTKEKKKEMYEYDLTRISEIEVLRNKWSDIVNCENSLAIMDKIRALFEPYFYIKKVLFDDVGYLMFKIFLEAIKPGDLIGNEEMGIDIYIKNSNEFVRNEVKKNCLVFDKLNEIQIRVGDQIVFYFSKNK